MIQSILRTTAEKLQKSNHIDDGMLEAKFLMADILQIEPRNIIRYYGKELSTKQLEKFNTYITERLAGKPIDRILGWREFYSRKFVLSNGTLSPRPDTEILIEQILLREEKTLKNFVDIGTGSGCIAITLLAEQSNWTASAWDISTNAIATTKQNAKNLNVDDRLTFNQIDILNDSPPSVKFDFIVSNPPYIKTDICNELKDEVKNYDPKSALDGGTDGLIFYRKIATIAPKILKENGTLYLEIGYDQATEIKEIFKNQTVEIVKDYGGNDRVAIIQY